MFYELHPDNALRFGDVLRDCTTVVPNLKETFNGKQYSIDVGNPSFSVVLTPCCSIGEGTIILAPLKQLNKSIWKNPYFVEDFTRINRRMQPEQSLSPDDWARLPLSEQEKRKQTGSAYSLLDLFIYDQHVLLSEYTLSVRGVDHRTRYYMISFKDIYKVNCSRIRGSQDAPLDGKCLQLAVETRAELREKLANYFVRIPDEDRIRLEVG